MTIEMLPLFSTRCNNAPVPNKRSADQIVLTFAVTKSLVGDIDTGRSRLRGMTRSQFVRDAIAEKLRGMGIAIPDAVVVPPDRTVPVLSPQDSAEVRNVADQLAVAVGMEMAGADFAAPEPESPLPGAPARQPSPTASPAPKKGRPSTKSPSKT